MRYAPSSAALEVFAEDELVGRISFLPATREWLAEADGHRRYWPSYAAALGFVESIAGLDARPVAA